MKNINDTKAWLKAISCIDRELDCERNVLKRTLGRIDELEREKENFLEVISVIKNPTYKAVLRMRYVQGMKWEEIAHSLNYSEQHIYRLNCDAIAEVHKIRTEQK